MQKGREKVLMKMNVSVRATKTLAPPPHKLKN
jgi:hypothetical protein